MGKKEGEIMIPKQWTAFVFIWCDCLHALLLVAVGKRGAKRGRARGRESEGNEVGRFVGKEREEQQWRVMGGKRKLWFSSNGR